MLVFGGVFYGLIWNFPWFIVYPLKFQRKKDIQAASRKYHLKVRASNFLAESTGSENNYTQKQN